MRPSEVVTMLKLAFQSQVPIMMWGSPGIGKSDMVRQVAEELDMQVEDVRMSQLSSVDLRGIPSVVDGTTVWNTPDFLPKDPQSRGVLFLDELVSAKSDVMAAGYQLVLDRQLGNYKLPDGWVVCAAGNRIQDRGLTNQMPTPLKNRFMHIDVEVNTDDWCAWALVNEIDTNVLAFIRYRPTLLNEFDVGDDEKRKKEAASRMKDANAFATPRSWSFLNRLLQVKVPSEIEYAAYSAVVGEGPAAEFIAFLKYARSMPSLESILMNPKTAEVPSEPATKYAVATGLATKATPSNFERIVEYLNRMPVEFAMMCV